MYMSVCAYYASSYTSSLFVLMPPIYPLNTNSVYIFVANRVLHSAVRLKSPAIFMLQRICRMFVLIIKKLEWECVRVQWQKEKAINVQACCESHAWPICGNSIRWVHTPTQVDKGPFSMKDKTKAAHITAKVTSILMLVLAAGEGLLIVRLSSTGCVW